RETLVQREGQPLVPGLAERGVLQHRGRGAGAPADVVRPPARSQRRDGRVVVDAAELMLPVHPQDVDRSREITPQLANYAGDSLGAMPLLSDGQSCVNVVLPTFETVYEALSQNCFW